MLVGVLALLLAAWTAAAGGEPRNELMLLAAASAAYVTGRLCGAVAVLRTLLPAAIAVAGAAAVLLAEDGLSGRALAGPLGYGNANGALCTLAAGSAVVAGLSAASAAARVLGILAGAAAGCLAVVTGSAAAAAASALLLLLGTAAAVRPRLVRALPAAAAAAVALAAVLTGALGLAGADAAGPAAAALSDRRVVLWSEALDLVADAPWRGVGAGAFRTTAPSAVADADAAWAHSAWLQQAAETGAPGGALLLLLALAALLAGGVRRSAPPTALASATVAAVLLQASIDYVLHFAVIAIVTAAVGGLSATRHVPIKPDCRHRS